VEHRSKGKKKRKKRNRKEIYEDKEICVRRRRMNEKRIGRDRERERNINIKH